MIKILRKWTLNLFVVKNKALQKSSNVSYDVFSHFLAATSLNNLSDLDLVLLSGILIFSCSSESVFWSLICFWGADVGRGKVGVWSVSDFLCFLDETTAVATYPDVLNFCILFVAVSIVGVCWIGFLIFALELFVFLAKCDIKSAVSTSLWNVDLLREWK